MERFKLRLNCQKVIGFGRQYGYYLDIINMANGLPVGKSILWRAEEMLDIQKSLEEDLKVLDLPCIGVQISLQINIQKHMLINPSMKELWRMISIYMVCIGMTKNCIHI